MVTQSLKFSDTKMITTQIKIGSSAKTDMYSTYGFIYISADNRLAAPIKEMEKTSYPEEEGEHIYPLAKEDAFDYKVKFLIEGTTLNRVNSKVATFNAALKDTSSMLKKVEFYNPDRKVKIVGYANPISEATDFWYTALNEKTDSAMVELTIRVVKPSDCNFNYTPTT